MFLSWWLRARTTQRRTRGQAAPYRTHYFTRTSRRYKRFTSGQRPAPLEGQPINERNWRAYLAAVERENPIAVADRYLDYLDRPGVSTYAQVAERFDVTTAKVCYHIALVRRLPPQFVVWLRGIEDPVILRHFCEHRLRPITRLDSDDEKRERLAEMTEEARGLAPPRTSFPY